MNNNHSDVFKFMAIREPDKLVDVDSARINASEGDEDTSVLLKRFNESLQSDTPAKTIEQIAMDYVNNKLDGAITYTISLRDLDSQLSKLDKKIHGKSEDGVISFIKNEIARLEITDENLSNWKKRIYDSFHAAIVLRKLHGAELRSIEHAIRTLHVISQVKTDAIDHDKEVKSALTKTITVSKSISPKTSTKELEKTNDENAAQTQKNAERVKKAIVEYEHNRAAINELTAAYNKDWGMQRLHQSEDGASVAKAHEIPAVYSGVLQRLGRWLGIIPISHKIEISERTTHKRQSVLPEEITNNISKKTKDRLTAIGSSSDKIEASFAIMRLEENTQEIANSLYSIPRGGTIANWGGGVPVADEYAGGEYFYEDPTEIFHKPGECPFSAVESPIVDDISPNEKGRFHSLGIGVLHVIKQKLIGHEIGEIAHIENVMASEKRSRNHRTLHRTEEFTSFELEKEEETERDLETTTRFELQKEINKEVQESTKKEAGVTVSGSYGPTVEFTANASIAGENSSSKSARLSTSYSKEVVDRSVTRIQEKIKEKRTLLTIDEVEVINIHSFKNQEKEAVHINGIYRWVNKKYEAQLFDYGQRELIEVVIPEPAAFLRYLATSHPKEGSTATKPLKPGYCYYGKFTPLSVKTLTEFNYLDWVTAYNIQDIEPPPPSFVIRSAAYDEDILKIESDPASATFPYASFSDSTFKIPPGYQAKTAWLTMNMTNIYTHGEIAIGKSSITVNWGGTISGDPQLPDIQPKGSIEVQLNNEEELLPIAISLRFIGVFSATLEVKCQRTAKALTEWKISTFNAIMNRYEVLKEEYEDAISSEGPFDRVDIQGNNPIENKDIILNELKRLAITQMTGQAFDGFDAMREKVPPQGFPQHNVDEAWREGQYIRFVEQAFEWENMQYLFYPYFWGKKKDWPITSRLEDTDPLFKSFLQAGSCRLNIPVRPGFVTTTNTFLSTGEIPWDSNDGSTVISSENEEDVDPFLSIAEEMKAQQGAVYLKSEGTVFHSDGDEAAILTGKDTSFDKDDENREINIAGKIYLIKSVDKEQQKITLNEDIAQSIEGNVQYGIGAKAIGVPWTVTIPTSLVILQEGNELPRISK